MTRTFVILTPGFPADESDSTCLPFIQSFVLSVKREYSDMNVIVLTFQYPFAKKEYHWNGMKVLGFGGENKGGFFRVIVWLQVWKRLSKIRKENNVIGLLSFWLGECALIGKCFEKKYSIQHYCWLQGQDARKGNRYVGLMKPKSDEIIALSDFLAAEFYRNYAIPIPLVIESGIDISLIIKENEKRDIDILGAGSLIALKQYDLFIEIIFELRKTFPSLRAVICGKGPEKVKLEQLIERFELRDNIILADEVPHASVLQLMQRSRIFLHTSIYEGYSTVCAEALFASAKVISFCKPMHHLIENWDIVLDKDEMIGRCKSILENDQLQFNSVITNPINDIAGRMLRLFGE